VCSHPGCTAAATEADHIVAVALRPDLRLRWSNLRPFCKPHHSARTARDQSFKMTAEARARTWPDDLKPSAIPLTIVCGAPGSGKSRYVTDHAAPGDLVIDLDEIKARLAGTTIYSAEARWTGPAITERNRMLRSLANVSAESASTSAWFIVSAPEPAERAWWQAQLGGTVHLMDTDEETCIARINADWRRVGHRARMVERCREWFALARGEGSRFRPPPGTAPPHEQKHFRQLEISEDADGDELFFG
jgi:5-methylcytosine-specific restriction protein A